MSGARRQSLIAACIAALAAALFMPNAATAGPVGDVVSRVSSSVNDTIRGLTGGGGGGAPDQQGRDPQAGTPPNYTPPAHGTNPHGQGTVGVVDILPEGTEPLPYDEDGGSEDIVVGRSRGEQNPDGSYHGHVTVASAALLGGELAGLDSEEGQTDTGPLPLLCPDVNTVCLGILTGSSTTDENSSENQFSVLRASLGGPTGINADAGSSTGNISDDGECQTASGSSGLVDASVGGELEADLITSSSESTACNNGFTSQNNDSSLINLGLGGLFVLNSSGAELGAGGNGIVIPILPEGCDEGTENTDFSILGLLDGVCHADDSNGDQDDDPYGVREALTIFPLPILCRIDSLLCDGVICEIAPFLCDGGIVFSLGGNGVDGNGFLKLTTGAAESAAVAPPDECPDPTNPDCPQPPVCPDPSNPECPQPPECPDPSNPDCPDDEDEDEDEVDAAGPPGGPREGPDALPFTGADLLTLLLIGGLVMGSGLMLMAVADRRRQSGGVR